VSTNRPKPIIPVELLGLLDGPLRDKAEQFSRRIDTVAHRRKDPAARLAKQLRRTERWLTFMVMVLITLGIVAVVVVGTASAVGAHIALGAMAVGALAPIISGAKAGIRLLGLKKQQKIIGVPQEHYELPSSRSTAFAEMTRLSQAESALVGLTSQLPAEVLSDAQLSAVAAVRGLRALSDKIVSIEHAARSTQAPELTQAVNRLAQQLAEGVDEYVRLVAAAASAVAATTPAAAQSDLKTATEGLANWTAALRELQP
jgi:nitrate reductase NapE component